MLAIQAASIFSSRIGNRVVLSWQCLKVDWPSFTLILTQTTFGDIQDKLDGRQMGIIIK